MFSLVSGFLQTYVFAKTEINIIILGLDGAGKTTLLERMKSIFKKMPGIPPERIPPTIGLNVGKMDVNNCRVTFWDLGGQVRMRSIWEKYFADAHGMIYVIDAADKSRVEEARVALDTVRQDEKLSDIPIVLLGNKQDLPEAAKADEVYQIFNSDSSSSDLFKVQLASCITCDGIEEGIVWVVDEARNRIDRIAS